MNFDALAVTWSPRLLSILRIMSGLLFLQHGTAKHLKFPTVPMFAKVSRSRCPASQATWSWSAACCLSWGCSRARRRSSCPV